MKNEEIEEAVVVGEDFVEETPVEEVEPTIEEMIEAYQRMIMDYVDKNPEAVRTKAARQALGLTMKPYVREGSKTQRNDPCPCGSGKKYKRCCLNN